MATVTFLIRSKIIKLNKQDKMPFVISAKGEKEDTFST